VILYLVHVSVFFIGTDAKLATHVLQFIFLGDTGLKFPIAHYPTSEATASDLYIIFWDVVKNLHQWGFKVCIIHYIITFIR
jgi:hypothetical protein